MTKLPVPLPQGFEVKVKVGDKVSVDDVLAEKKEAASENLPINISQGLGVSPDKVNKHLKKNPGDKILEGDVVAEASNIISNKSVVSKIEGIFLRLDKESGEMIIKVNRKNDSALTSPIDGEVLEITDNQIIINSEKEAILGKKGIGEQASAEIYFIEKPEADPKTLKLEISGKIIFAHKIGREALAKALGLGAVGVIGFEIADENLNEFSSKGVKNPIIEVSSESLTFLKSAKKVIMDGSQKIIVKA